jgi:hypothetical protein
MTSEHHSPVIPAITRSQMKQQLAKSQRHYQLAAKVVRSGWQNMCSLRETAARLFLQVNYNHHSFAANWPLFDCRSCVTALNNGLMAILTGTVRKMCENHWMRSWWAISPAWP